MQSPSILSSAAEEADDERDDEESEEEEEQDLRNTGRGAGNTAETKNTGNQSDHEKDESIIKHGCLREVILL